MTSKVTYLVIQKITLNLSWISYDNKLSQGRNASEVKGNTGCKIGQQNGGILVKVTIKRVKLILTQ